jgi:DNA repair protein RadA/Sms
MMGRADQVTLHLAPMATLQIPPVQPRLFTTSVLDVLTSGGLPLGGATLVGGAPGAGKSTLLLEAASKVPWESFYVSGEESAVAIAQRAERLGVRCNGVVAVAATSDADAIAEAIVSKAPALCVVDSIQAVTTRVSPGQMGSPTQLRAVVDLLTKAARKAGTALVLVCHETKVGGFAGPRTVEHLVDVVLRVERSPRRIVAVKNRFGPAPVVVPLTMNAVGAVRVAT